jgi:predicted nucleic acid-binding protein
MKPPEEYFVDSSVWISYLRGAEPSFSELIDRLIDENKISVDGIVMTELLLGARSREEIDRLSSALSGLKYVGGGPASSQAAGRNGFILKKMGLSVPLSDLIIATDCIENDLILIERDAHFAAISAHLPLRLYRRV